MKKKMKYANKASKQNKNIKTKSDYFWIIEITLIAFIITFLMSTFSEVILKDINLVLSLLIIFFFIILGIIFDMIGLSVTVADKKVFHSMASKKVRGAKTALTFIDSASKVSSFCNDVIGDICGILSGSCAATVAVLIASKTKGNPFFISLVITSLIAALTIGGKALGKSLAINHSNTILYSFSKIICLFRKEK